MDLPRLLSHAKSLFGPLFMNPFRVFLRITEYLAGPPVHEEISTLQERAESLSQQVTDLTLQRDQLLRDVTSLSAGRNALTKRVCKIEGERNELLQRRDILEQELTAIRQRVQVETRHEELVLCASLENPRVGRPARSMNLRSLRDHEL